MDTHNIFREDTGLNRIKTFLVGASDGQTYPINDHYLCFITNPSIVNMLDKSKMNIAQYLYDFSAFETLWDDIIGYKYDYKVDDPSLTTKAQEIHQFLLNLIGEINHHPENYFECIHKPEEKVTKFYWEASSDDGSYEDHSDKLYETQVECYDDMRHSAVEKTLWNTEWTDVIEDVGPYKENGIVKTLIDLGLKYDILFYPHKIVQKSYSGTYTYTIKTKEVPVAPKKS